MTNGKAPTTPESRSNINQPWSKHHLVKPSNISPAPSIEPRLTIVVMLAQSLRVSRTSLTRCLARQQPTFTRSFIAPTAVRQADLVQELYLRELKSYKPPAPKASDSEGQVKKWTVPAAPRSPEEAETSLAEELKAYETQEVEVEGQASAGEPAQAAVEEDWFEEEATFGEPETAAH